MTPLIDAICRGVLIVGYRALVGWSFVTRPVIHGAHVIVRRPGPDGAGDQLLIVRNSYKDGLTVPCGGIRRRETPVQAASRELAEEVGVCASPERLRALREITVDYRFRRDHAHFFELALEGGEDPEIRIDRREVVWAGYVGADEALEMDIVPQLRILLESGGLDGRSTEETGRESAQGLTP